jgi:hypothetical protein
MSPAQRSSTAALAVLLAEIRKDRGSLEKLATRLAALGQRWQEVAGDEAQVALACVPLHGWYTCLETLLERIARGVDGRVPPGPRSHHALLQQMTVGVPELRDALLSAEQERELSGLLKFRHLFLRARNLDLDPARVSPEVVRLQRVAPGVMERLFALEAFLRDGLAALVRG